MTASTYSVNGSTPPAVPGVLPRREFSVAGEYPYNRRGPFRWVVSHLLRYKGLLVIFLLAASLTNILFLRFPGSRGWLLTRC